MTPLFRIFLLILLAVYLFGCGPVDCPEHEKVDHDCWTEEQEAQFVASVNKECEYIKCVEWTDL